MKNSVLIFAVVIGAILLCACSDKETFGHEPEVLSSGDVQF